MSLIFTLNNGICDLQHILSGWQKLRQRSCLWEITWRRQSPVKSTNAASLRTNKETVGSLWHCCLFVTSVKHYKCRMLEYWAYSIISLNDKCLVVKVDNSHHQSFSNQTVLVHSYMVHRFQQSPIVQGWLFHYLLVLILVPLSANKEKDPISSIWSQKLPGLKVSSPKNILVPKPHILDSNGVR